MAKVKESKHTNYNEPSNLILFNLNFLLWRHVFTILDRLFSIIFLSPLKMASFSAKHKLHVVPPQLYDCAVETMDHFIDGSTPLSFARQTSFDSSVAFLLLRWVNECL